jgi:hypothetical protein
MTKTTGYSKLSGGVDGLFEGVTGNVFIYTQQPVSEKEVLLTYFQYF